MMLEPAIEAFFTERKEAWLKKNLNAKMTEEQIREKELECEEVFALHNWLPNAAKRAGQISLSTHPCTFSHPSSRKNKNGYSSSVIAKADYQADGFLRSGNLEVEPDALGNAAALDVYKFLTLEMQDGRSLLQHIQAESELAAQLLLSAGADIAEMREGFLAMATTDGELVTSSKIKQVYFPVKDEPEGYHLLSILSHSGYLFEMRKRLDWLRFSEQTKAARELRKNNQYSEMGYQEIYNLTTIGYGGTKPQNISVLNNQNAGKAHLLLSMPPELSSRKCRLPTRNFFGDVLYPMSMEETFQAFHRLLQVDHNNISIRKGRDYRIQEYLDQLILKMWHVRKAFSEYDYSRPEKIPSYQKTWLFPEYEKDRLNSQYWLDELIQEAARYFDACYKRVIGKSAIVLGDEEHKAFAKVIEKNKEALV